MMIASIFLKSLKLHTSKNEFPKGSPIVSLALSMDFVRLIYLEVFSMLINVRKI